jgi:steroid delta-isomerase-like uncharacterized protein
VSELQVVESLERYAAAKNRHDVDAILALCDESCYYESVGIEGRVQGKDALGKFYSALFGALPDYYGDFDGRAVSGDTVVVWGRFGGTMLGEYLGNAPTGRRIEVPVAFVCTFRDGLLTSDTGYFDVRTFSEQAGLSIATDPAPAAGG